MVRNGAGGWGEGSKGSEAARSKGDERLESSEMGPGSPRSLIVRNGAEIEDDVSEPPETSSATSRGSADDQVQMH